MDKKDQMFLINEEGKLLVFIKYGDGKNYIPKIIIPNIAMSFFEKIDIEDAIYLMKVIKKVKRLQNENNHLKEVICNIEIKYYALCYNLTDINKSEILNFCMEENLYPEYFSIEEIENVSNYLDEKYYKKENNSYNIPSYEEPLKVLKRKLNYKEY